MIKKILAAACALAVLAGTATTALPRGAFDLGASIETEALRYRDFEYNVLDDGTVEISKYNGNATELEIPSKINKKKVTSIGYYAFGDCTNLKGVTIPNGVTSIGDGAFSGCTSLTSITIPNSVTSIGDGAFSGCTSLTSITIPESVRIIWNYVFERCRNLKSITIPDGVSIISREAFLGCSSLKSVTVPRSVYIIEEAAFGYDVDDEYNRSKIPGFKICGYSKSAAEEYAVENDIDFESLSVIDNGLIFDILDDETLKVVGYTETDTEIVIPEEVEGKKVTSIGDYAFESCESLESITIPDGVTNIGNGAFSLCPSLAEITIPDSVKNIGDNAFNNCSSLVSIKIPDGVTSIKASTFWYCTSLESITIPDSITSIEDSAFFSCTSLTSITIPNSVTSIGYGAFQNCKNLTSITIPKSVESIDEEAFGYYIDNENHHHTKLPGFKIYCFEGTAGEQYAIDNGFDYVLIKLGDTNGDSKINVKDLTAFQRYINGWGNKVLIPALDVNNDGKVNVKDLTYLQKMINGWFD